MNQVTGIIRRGRKLIELLLKFVVSPLTQELFFGSYSEPLPPDVRPPQNKERSAMLKIRAKAK